MASRSRALTRPGADPEGRFRPPMTAEERESAEALLAAMYPKPEDRGVQHVNLPPVYSTRDLVGLLGIAGLG